VMAGGLFVRWSLIILHFSGWAVAKPTKILEFTRNILEMQILWSIDFQFFKLEFLFGVIEDLRGISLEVQYLLCRIFRFLKD